MGFMWLGFKTHHGFFQEHLMSDLKGELCWIQETDAKIKRNKLSPLSCVTCEMLYFVKCEMVSFVILK